MQVVQPIKNNTNKVDELWERTVAIHLKDKLWLDDNIYDAGHFLMVPMHAAFVRNNTLWKQQFSKHFEDFMANTDDISDGRLNQLHYYYLLSRFLVLSKDHGDTDLIPAGAANYLYDKVIQFWREDPAWQWENKPFKGIRERVEWKLLEKAPKRSYYRAIIDEEFFLFALAGDLSSFYHGKDKHKQEELKDILDVAYKVFSDEIKNTDGGGWLMQPGIYAEHPDYAYAGNDNKAVGLGKFSIADIAMDTSHSHRFPLWLTSLAGAYVKGSAENQYFQKLLSGLKKQFINKVLIDPVESFPAYRTANFMDGRNGVYRWNYATQGVGNGYGPYELSGTLNLGWWAFLAGAEMDQVYAEMARKFPMSDEMTKLYIGPGTTRKRHPLVSGANKYVNGYIELICILASQI